jgi:hypothetical protein
LWSVRVLSRARTDPLFVYPFVAAMEPRPISSKTQDALDELARLNPRFRVAVKEQPLAGTPLFEEAVQQPSMTPPRFVRQSVTQLVAWKAIQARTGKMQQDVLIAISDHQPCTAQKIGRWLGRPTSTITARIKELRDELGLIEECGSEHNAETGMPNTLYRLTFANADSEPADGSPAASIEKGADV